MDFYIQASCPQRIEIFNETDSNLWDAIESIYPLYCESAFIMWKGIAISLSYKYDISIIMDDILYMLTLLQKEERHSYAVQWPSNTFNHIWELDWKNNELTIHSEWHDLPSSLEEILSENNKIMVDKIQFIREWKKVLSIIKNDLTECGYSSKQIEGLDKLKLIEENVDEFGILYVH